MKSKRNIKSILVTAIIGIITLICFNKCFASNTASVIVDVANIRKTADADSIILEQVSKGQSVEIIEKTGDWYKIKYNNIEGYLRQDLLEVSSDSNTVTENTATESVTNTATENTSTENTVATESTNSQENSGTENEQKLGTYTTLDTTKLKIMPLINSENIEELKKGIEVNVIEINNKWALVESDDNTGWVVYEDLKIKETSQENTQGNQEQKEEEKTDEQQTEEQQTEEQQTDIEETDKQEEITETQATVTEKNVKMYVNSEVVNLRSSESTDSSSVKQLTKGTEVTVISESSNGWSKVSVSGTEGYIATRLLTETKPAEVTSRSLEESRTTNNETTQTTQNTQTSEATTTTSTSASATTTTTQQSSSKGEQIVATAKKYLGCKYVYGGTTPSGFDCSGFTQYVYKQNGISISRTAEAQASNGTAVSKSNLQLGDLVIFTSHVGIYIGNNQFIHAANASKGVITTSLSDNYYVKNYITARRIVN